MIPLQWWFLLRPIAALAGAVSAILVLLYGQYAHAHDWADPRYAQLNQYQRDFLQKQRRPGTSYSCCSEADGDQVDEEIRYDDKGIGHYWVNSEKTDGKWIIVPDEAIIREPNLHGRPVAWFRWEYGSHITTVRPDPGYPQSRSYTTIVFCYLPGPLL